MSTDSDATILGSQPRAASEDDLPVGTIVGEYRVDAVIGEGGFGTVYRVTHPIIGKTAAIKVLKRQMSANGEMVSRFIAEARAVNQIRHRNIIDIFAFGQLPDGRHYYVMEFLDGVSLEAHVRSRGGRLAIGDALAIFRPLARALHAAHARGIAHRDIKPENVLLTFGDEGETLPKLLDFGIAKLAGDGASKHRTAPGVQMGTPAYMAPEQVHGRETDHRADIYTFGVMVFEVLTGRLPFVGTSAMDVMIKHVSVIAPPMSSLAPDLPPELDGPVLHMMSKEPDARPSSMLDAIDAIVAAAEQAGVVEKDRFARLGSGELSTRSVGKFTPSAHGTSPGLERGPSAFNTAGDKITAAPSRGLVWVAGALFSGVLAVALLWTLARTKPTENAAREDVSSAPTGTATMATPVETAASGPSVAPALSTSPAPTASAAESSDVELSVTAVPADAEIYIGDKKLGRAGETLALPRGSEKVKLTIRRAGYVPKQVEVDPSKNVLVEKVVLLPAKPKEYTW